MGLSLDTSRLSMAQAVLEGVAFRMAEVMEAMSLPRSASVPVSIDGGMSRNSWFCQFLADVLGRSIRISGEPELTALGCAQLAARGAGAEIGWRLTGRILEPRPVPADWHETFRAARTAVQAFGERRTDATA